VRSTLPACWSPDAREPRERAGSFEKTAVASKDIIVIGGSAGAVEALKSLVEALPHDFGASVLAVVHIPPSSPGRLPEILQRRSAVRVAWAEDGEPIEAGRVYVASADRHLVVEAGHVRLTRAPRENHSRPAIDPLFRSAALVYGARVIGVILSGRLDDGTAGLWAVRERGGTTVVQDPDDAVHADMPRNALEYTVADHVVPARELGPLLVRLAGEPVPSREAPVSPALELEVKIALEADALGDGVMSLGPTTPYSCPECHGVLVRVPEGRIPRFRCHTGHAYVLDSLLASTSESVEKALWSALRAVEETVLLLRDASRRETENGARDGKSVLASRFEQKACEAEARAELIRQALMRHESLSLETVRDSLRAEARNDERFRAEDERAAGATGSAMRVD
jgi:two-component system chemotaxis response regulator CheB